MRRYQRLFWVALLWAVVLSAVNFLEAQPFGNVSVAAAKFDFGLIGDLPYTAEQETQFQSLVRDMNAARLAFVVHDGDFKSGSTLCNDETFYQRYNLFNTFVHPFVFVPGDNEWTDCYRDNNGSYDPLERLDKLREIFFQGNQSQGKRTIALTRQSNDPQYSKFRENVRWIYGNVVFVGLNVTGSNNNFGRTPEADAEYYERNAADLAWLKEGFAIAKRNGSQGIMLVIQANPGFELAATDPKRAGYNDFLAALEAEAIAFKKPVVLVHGDSHYFRIDKPLLNSRTQQRLENFTRVETFGSPDVHWVRATVDFRDPNLFSFTQEIIQ